MKAIYNTLQQNSGNIKTGDIEPSDALNKYKEMQAAGYTILYVGKHNSRSLLEKEIELEIEDFRPHLLIECRIFNEEEEYYIVSDNIKLFIRTFKEENHGNERTYIVKNIRLRKPKSKDDSSPVLEIHHYISEKGRKGYDFIRYYKVHQL